MYGAVLQAAGRRYRSTHPPWQYHLFDPPDGRPVGDLVNAEGPVIREASCGTADSDPDIGQIPAGRIDLYLLSRGHLAQGPLVVNLPLLVVNLHFFLTFVITYGNKVREILLIKQGF